MSRWMNSSLLLLSLYEDMEVFECVTATNGGWMFVNNVKDAVVPMIDW